MNSDISCLRKTINETVGTVRALGLYPDIKLIVGSSSSPHILIDGKEVIHYCSGNYLGLADRSELKQAAKNAIDTYGVGTVGSRVVSGTLDIHREVEREIAAFLGKEDGLFVATGFILNSSLIPALFNFVPTSVTGIINAAFARNKQGIIFSDELNHASIIDGCRLANAEIVVYKHADYDDLESKLKRYRRIDKKLIVSDGVFSMDGDIAPLRELIKLKKKYGTLLMIDDAHAVGVLGKSGKGIVEYLGADPSDVDLIMGTFSKAFGANGGFVTADKVIIEFLRISIRSFIFSGAPAPAISAAVLAALAIIKEDGGLRERLTHISNMLREGLGALGFKVIPGESQIIPIFIGDERVCVKFSELLLGEGIFVAAMRWPATSRGKSRIRLTPMASHTDEDVRKTIDAFEKVGKELKLI